MVSSIETIFPLSGDATSTGSSSTGLISTLKSLSASASSTLPSACASLFSSTGSAGKLASIMLDGVSTQLAANATAMEIINVKIYPTGFESVRSIPNIPVTPVPVAPSLIMEANIAPTAPPRHPAMKGLKNLKFTPKIAGSVIPINAESDDGKQRLLILGSFVFTATARQAPPCATLTADARGNQYVTPYFAI